MISREMWGDPVFGAANNKKQVSQGQGWDAQVSQKEGEEDISEGDLSSRVKKRRQAQ